MSNSSKDHTSIRVFAPPGGRSNNIFGTEPEETNSRAGTLAGQYKQAQMKSNIFGTDDSAPTRSVSNKNKSNIFGTVDDDEQNKRQTGPRQGLRVGYNPINGEAYSGNVNVNSKPTENEKQQTDSSVKPSEEKTDSTAAAAPPTTNSVENSNGHKADNPIDGNSAQQKNVHTSVRVFHPPGGKSSGPLW